MLVAGGISLLPCAYLFKLFYFTPTPDQIGVTIPASLFVLIPLLWPFAEPGILNGWHGVLFPILAIVSNLAIYCGLALLLTRDSRPTNAEVA
jgi:hypothetical protein